MQKTASRLASIPQLLLVIYVILLIALLVVRVIEFKELQKTRDIIREYQDRALTRQAILNRLPQGIDYVQVNILRMLFYTDKAAIAKAENTLYAEVKSNDRNMDDFERLITDQQEQQFFDTLTFYKAENSINRAKLLQLIAAGKRQEAADFNFHTLANSFENFQHANTALAEYVSGRDNVNIKKSEDYLKVIENRNIWLNATIVVLLMIMGLMLSKAIQRLRSINVKLAESEKKYRLIVEHSHEIITQWDKEGKFIFANNYSKEKLEYTDREFSGMSVMDILSEESRYLYVPHPTRSELGEILTNVRRTLKSKSGKRIMVEGNIALDYKNEIFAGATAYLTDVTEKNLYEQKLTRAIIKTQEHERYEIGSELHDNICQILATCQLTLGMMKKSLLPTARELYDQTFQNIALATREIRNLSHRLAPAFYDDVTLEDACKNLLATFNIDKRYVVALNFDDASKGYPLSFDMQLNLYRILQEQVGNIFKHSKATSIEVSVAIKGQLLQMTTTDNGIGFDVDEVKGGIGLANMNRRSELLSGSCTINTAIGKGCAILVEIPLN